MVTAYHRLMTCSRHLLICPYIFQTCSPYISIHVKMHAIYMFHTYFLHVTDTFHTYSHLSKHIVDMFKVYYIHSRHVKTWKSSVKMCLDILQNCLDWTCSRHGNEWSDMYQTCSRNAKTCSDIFQTCPHTSKIGLDKFLACRFVTDISHK